MTEQKKQIENEEKGLSIMGSGSSVAFFNDSTFMKNAFNEIDEKIEIGAVLLEDKTAEMFEPEEGEIYVCVPESKGFYVDAEGKNVDAIYFHARPQNSRNDEPVRYITPSSMLVKIFNVAVDSMNETGQPSAFIVTFEGKVQSSRDKGRSYNSFQVKELKAKG